MSNHSESHMVGNSWWPMIGSIALFFLAIGIVNWIHGSILGPILFFVGALVFAYMLFGWFGAVVKESQAGWYDDPQVVRSFRWGMFWFIFTEVAFFGSFFFAFFYARLVSIPTLGGAYSDALMTHYLLWPNFQSIWPLVKNPDPSQFVGAQSALGTWGIPALNTLILMTSDVVITWGYWELLRNHRTRLIFAQMVTMVLAIAFIILQIVEYGSAYTEHGLKLSSGIYGATFYMLTGVHGTHVLVGIVMVFVIMLRTIRGDFNAQNNFAVAALTWYWHFIDLLWLVLFIFVYWW